jgi:hypothetical protein
MLPVELMPIDFEPSELWLTVTVCSTALTHALSVIVRVAVLDFFEPFMVMENVPEP